jgi:hypothetical protein
MAAYEVDFTRGFSLAPATSQTLGAPPMKIGFSPESGATSAAGFELAGNQVGIDLFVRGLRLELTRSTFAVAPGAPPASTGIYCLHTFSGPQHLRLTLDFENPHGDWKNPRAAGGPKAARPSSPSNPLAFMLKRFSPWAVALNVKTGSEVDDPVNDKSVAATCRFRESGIHLNSPLHGLKLGNVVNAPPGLDPYTAKAYRLELELDQKSSPTQSTLTAALTIDGITAAPPAFPDMILPPNGPAITAVGAAIVIPDLVDAHVSVRLLRFSLDVLP